MGQGARKGAIDGISKGLRSVKGLLLAKVKKKIQLKKL